MNEGHGLAEAIGGMAVVFVSLVLALLAFVATQASPPRLTAAKLLALGSLIGGVGSLALAWRVAGISVLLLIAGLPCLFGVLAFVAVRYMRNAS